MKERISWKTILKDNEEKLEKGETITVQTPNPTHYIGLRVAAKSMGYTAHLRGGVTYVSKVENANILRGSVVVGSRKQLKPRAMLKRMDSKNRQEAVEMVEFVFYMMLKDGTSIKEQTRETTLDSFAEYLRLAFWCVMEEEVELTQPAHATLRELVMEGYEKDSFGWMTDELFSAIVRLRISTRQLVDSLDAVIPVMSPADAFKLLEERYKDKLRAEVIMCERRLDFRQQSEAETEKNLPLSDEINA